MELLFDPTNSRRVKFKEGNDIVGRIDCQEEATQINLWSFFIFEEFKGRGLAHKAIEEIKKHFRGNKLWLCVRKDNEIALKVYNKANFTVIKDEFITPNEYQMICDNP